MITRNDVVALMERNMRTGFLKGTKEYTPIRTEFVDEPKSDGAFETYADMGAVPWPEAIAGQAGYQGADPRTGGAQTGGMHEGGQITVLGGNERSMTIYNRDWTIPIGIWHNAINDARVTSLEGWAKSAGMRYEQHKDFICFDALNNGASDNYGRAYDKQVFFSASHADPGAQYTTSQTNVFTSPLTLDNFEPIYVAAGSYLDDRGKSAGFIPNLLVHALDLTRTAAQITDNFDDYETSDRKKNPYAGELRRIKAPGGWLDSTAWYLLCTSAGAKPIHLQIREVPRLVSWDNHEIGSGVRYYKWIARYEAFYGDWRLGTQGNS